jgi:hypothetical protein
MSGHSSKAGIRHKKRRFKHWSTFEERIPRGAKPFSHINAADSGVFEGPKSLRTLREYLSDFHEDLGWIQPRAQHNGLRLTSLLQFA